MKYKNAITLIEIVVSMAISSIVILAAYSFFNASIRSWDYSSSSMDASENSTFVIDFLEKIIKQNNLQLNKWYIKSINTDISQVETKIADFAAGPWGILFKDGFFFPVKSIDEIPEHADYYGIYRKNSSNEVILYKNSFDIIKGERTVETTVLGRNVTELDFDYFDNEWNTIEVWDGLSHNLGSMEVKSLNISVISTVGFEKSQPQKTITIWRE